MKAASPKKKKKRAIRKWSGRVTHASNALDLKNGIFKSDNPGKIAASLKRSAEHSTRRKSAPLSLRNVDADFLYQPGGENFARETQAHPGTGQGCAARPIRQDEEKRLRYFSAKQAGPAGA